MSVANFDVDQVYYNQSMKIVYANNFTGSYTLDGLSPYTMYSLYVIAVTQINAMDNVLEGSRSAIVIRRTLAGSK